MASRRIRIDQRPCKFPCVCSKTHGSFSAFWQHFQACPLASKALRAHAAILRSSRVVERTKTCDAVECSRFAARKISNRGVRHGNA